MFKFQMLESLFSFFGVGFGRLGMVWGSIGGRYAKCEVFRSYVIEGVSLLPYCF